VIRGAGGSGPIVAVGETRDFTGGTLEMDWYAASSVFDEPTAGDTLETVSKSTVSGLSGHFDRDEIVWLVSAAEWSGSCPDLYTAQQEDVGAGLVYNGAAGGDISIGILQTHGTRDEFTSGAHVCSPAGDEAVLGTVTPTDTATLSGGYTNAYAQNRLGPSLTYDYFSQRIDYVIWVDPVQQASGDWSFRTGIDANSLPYLSFLGSYLGGIGDGENASFGDPGNAIELSLHGDFWHYDGSSHYAHIAPTTNLSADRTYVWTDADGTLPALDTTGCDDNDPILAGSTPGSAKCGAPGGGSIKIDDSGNIGSSLVPVVTMVMDSGAGSPITYGTSKGLPSADLDGVHGQKAMLTELGHSGNYGTGPAIAFVGGGRWGSTGNAVCTAHGWTAARWVADCGSPVAGAAISCVWRTGGAALDSGDEGVAHCE
jgi:hypothetical protein